MSVMSPAEEVFFAALERPTPTERAAYLEAVCAGRPELRARVEKLLAAHPKAGSFLEPSPADGTTGTAAPDSPFDVGESTGDFPGRDERVGSVLVGKYKLVEEIGEGGMGSVYMAQQTEPVKRAVAVKVIKAGMDSKAVLARFEAERQALAMMDHPNIARVLDAGTTESGRPFVVMELVKGVPITKFCDARKLTPRERLELFVPVCQAIQHAHQKGVIHRDIKPSNVLVAMYDDRPVPKVIDFGVAKAAGPTLTDRTLMTGLGAVVGTPEYMSPEQASFNNLDIDTRSDVYSLGVLLYELLTGTTPVDRKTLGKAALLEVLRIVREVEAPKPSAKLSTIDTLPTVAANRGMEPAKLSRLMKGELDWVLLKALEKDRTRRYETANGLARDVQRYLADEPVEACPPSTSYRLRKLMRKYRSYLATAAIFVALLVAGVVLSTLLAIWATSAEHEANRQRVVSDEAKQEAEAARELFERQRDQARLAAYATGMGLAQNAWYENNINRARELLTALPTVAAGHELRGFEWHYLSRLCKTEATTLKSHKAAVWCVAYSPVGRYLASASYDRIVKIWDGATGREAVDLKGHRDLVNSVAFSPDGRRLASGSADKTVKIWDTATWEELTSLAGHDGPVWSVAFSPDGRRLASGSADKTVKIWDSATWQELTPHAGHEGPVLSVAFSPDGRRLASGSADKKVKIWDITTGSVLRSLSGHTGAVLSVAFSPDGRRIASGSADSKVNIWDDSTGQMMHTLPAHTNQVTSVAFSPDGRRLASGSDDNKVRIWDSGTWQELATYSEHLLAVRSVAFSPDGRSLASGSRDHTVKIWDASAGKEPFSFTTHPHRNPGGVAFCSDGRLLASVAAGNTVRIWDAVAGEAQVVVEGHDKPVRCMAFSPDGRRLASGSLDNIVSIWDASTGREVHKLPGHGQSVLCVAFSPDGGWLVSGSSDRTIKFWDSATGRLLRDIRGLAVDVRSVAVSPDGKRLASGHGPSWQEGGTVRIWDSNSAEVLHTLPAQIFAVRTVTFSPDGQLLAAGGEDHTVRIWDSVTGRVLHTLVGHAGAINCVVFSPDGRRLATASSDTTVKLWDTATSQELVTYKGGDAPVRQVSFSPDGQRLFASNDDGTIILWETSIPPEIRERRASKTKR
jgi:WD40 repeat protein/serine/threonine protein kinase